MAELSLKTIVYRFRGGAPPYRGYHKGDEKTVKVSPSTSINDLHNKVIQAHGIPTDQAEGWGLLSGGADDRWENISVQTLPEGTVEKAGLTSGSVIVIQKGLAPGMCD